VARVFFVPLQQRKLKTIKNHEEKDYLRCDARPLWRGINASWQRGEES
jgi:hypothetical protein